MVYLHPQGQEIPPAEVPVEIVHRALADEGPTRTSWRSEINAESKLIAGSRRPMRLPSHCPTGFLSAPVVLNAEAPAVLLDDGSPAKPYLTLQTTNTRRGRGCSASRHSPMQHPQRRSLTCPWAMIRLGPRRHHDSRDGRAIHRAFADRCRRGDRRVRADQHCQFGPDARPCDVRCRSHGLRRKRSPARGYAVGTLDSTTTTWTVEADLLESGESDPVFVVETESDGSARFRFGDNTNGLSPISGTSFTTGFRVGNGTPGNVGARKSDQLRQSQH